ncbi:hypothetical protein [Microbulbifer magnicolonia]|uniref:hypothetical protein n=1 Tax=Microbulbifer magnicolonia TaxID=3109744 RepID=UPI002B40C2E2|nr:hypothetical protein [Microbulbifer sp. GG15]
MIAKSGGVTITLINGGVPVPLGTDFSGTTTLGHLQNAKTAIGNTNLRSQHQADIIIVYDSFVYGACGVATSDNWLRDDGLTTFVPTNGLDLRRKDIDYVALVETRCADTPTLSAHEFGHLLGAAHHIEQSPPTTQHPGLYDDSHGWREKIVLPPEIGGTIEI